MSEDRAVDLLQDALVSLQRAHKMLGEHHPVAKDVWKVGDAVVYLIEQVELWERQAGAGESGAPGQGLADTVGLIEGINDLKKQGLL